MKCDSERGAALAIAVIVVAILSIIGLTALAFASSEARIAGSDLHRTQAFYAASSGLEKMTNDFGNLFRIKLNPTTADLQAIAANPPAPLLSEGYTFDQHLEEDSARLSDLRAMQGIADNLYPRVNIPDGPYSGLYASLIPYKMTSTATRDATRSEVKLERDFNNYLVPLFQFGIFSNEDLEIHPGPLMTINGRVHSNGNIYALSSTVFQERVTAAGEFVRDSMRGGEPNNQGGRDDVSFQVNGITIRSTMGYGSVKSGSGFVGGPNLSGSTPGSRGYFPGSPNGVVNPEWESESVKPVVAGVPNRFGGQLLTRTTGAMPIRLPLEMKGNSTAEIIKRALPADDEILAPSRFHSKSQLRILIDDETAGSGVANVAGIPAGKGVVLSQFTPSVLNGGNVLKRIDNSGTISGSAISQRLPDGTLVSNTPVVRGVKSAAETVDGNYIPPGSGITGRILIEIVRPDGTAVDVTQTILSMGLTEGEPNAIVNLQRPLWAAYTQGSRDRLGNSFDLQSLTRNYQSIADGEIADPTSAFRANRGFIGMTESSANEDGGVIVREASPSGYNTVVPINVYNVREGWVRSELNEYDIYERGITSVVELNMRNLARWFDGVYDTNLLAGTNARSTEINGESGYIVYVSDRRGDKVKAEYLADGTSYASTNGIVDNEDIYGPNDELDAGEDVIDFGWSLGGLAKKGRLQKDITELPDTGNIWSGPFPSNAPVASRLTRANSVLGWRNPNGYFRRAVRLFDAATLTTTGAAGKLSSTKGITIASENMVYVWGNFNATGITGIPANGSTLNNGGYTGSEIPASVICDALIPLSKTWFDANSALYPEGTGSGETYRMADEALPSTSQSTTFRGAVIAGMTLSSLTATPGRDVAGQRRSGGIHNFPRFLEMWTCNSGLCPWNYTGSFVPLYHSTQAVSQHEDFRGVNYSPPRRNWSFNSSYLNPLKLPPGTPYFQYIQATGFRQSLR